MKKLITLLLALAGMVGTANATMYILGSGSFGNWSIDNVTAMLSDASDVHYCVFDCTDDEDISFCFSTNDGTTGWDDFNSSSYRPSSNQTIVLGEKYGYVTGQSNNSFTLNAKKGIKYLIRISTITNNGQVVVMSSAEKVYFIGSLDTSNDWDPSSGTEMESDDFTYTYTINPAGSTSDSNYSFLSFTTKLSESSSDWDGIKTYRFGATSTDAFDVDYDISYYTGTNLTLAYWNGDSKAFKFPKNGKYKLTVDARKNSLRINKLESVTTNSGGYSTYVNTQPLNITDATAYYATDNNNGSATAYAITNPAASTPMLIKGDASTTYYFAVAASGTDYSSTNAFKAGTGFAVSSYDDKTPPTEFRYILNGGDFYLANGQKVAANKAYLQLSKEAGAGARVLKFLDNEETGINAITARADDADACYNLSGQRVSKPDNGLFIKGGKKIIVK